MAYHARRSPSQTKRFLTCPGALAVCSTLPIEQQNTAGEAARLGTCVHKIIEESLKHGVEPETYRDRIVSIEGDDGDAVIQKANAKPPRDPSVFWYVIDSDMIDGATVMTDYVRTRAKKLRAVMHTESRTNPLPDRDDTDGSADVTLTTKDFSTLELVDYKNGYNVVEHRDNDQLLSYLLGKAEESQFKYKNYIITIVQPNAPHEEGRVRSVPVTVKELKAHSKRLRAGIALCEEAEEHPKAPQPDWEKLNSAWVAKYLKASDDGCFFCDARPVCPAKRAAMHDKTRGLFNDKLTPMPSKAPKVGNAQDAADVLKWAPYAEAYIKAAEQYVQRALENGKTVEGFKLVEGRSNRKLKPEYDDAAALAAAMHKAGLMKSLKRAELIELIMKKPTLRTGPDIEGLLPREDRKTFAAAFLDKPPGRMTVAPADDGRTERKTEPGEIYKTGHKFGSDPFADTEFG